MRSIASAPDATLRWLWSTLPRCQRRSSIGAFRVQPGAFTGADRKGRKGKFEQAAGGTILLDEIGDMPTDVQAKLLRVLQDRMVQRIGGERPYEVDFRLVSATNRRLQALVADDKFRLDLYYRISPIVIDVPPLRARNRRYPEPCGHLLEGGRGAPWPITP